MWRAVVGVVLVGVLLIVVATRKPYTPVNIDNYLKIQLGMTKVDLIAIMGPKNSEFVDHPLPTQWIWSNGGARDYKEIRVWIDDNGKAIKKWHVGLEGR